MYNTAITADTPLSVYTLSDASGQTAENVTKACVAQFAGLPVRIVRLPRAVNVQQVENMVALAAAQGPALFAYTMVQDGVREAFLAAAGRHGIPTVDLLGHLIEQLSAVLGAAPNRQAGALHTKDEEYFRRMDAIDFAIKYDDGKSPQGLRQAELVILGVSRTSKTPTCMYLAQNQGIKAANVPLVPGADPPKEIFELPPGRIVGLTVKPEMLTEIRGSRLVTLGLPPESAYADKQKITDELGFADQLFRRLRCPVVDVTFKAIEETASEILELLQRKELF
ncbi:MAG: pyruvate, water dikinase regulatory protein [Candidatus Sericytochromatia bacterium]|nr:pyruvate, water dikinase regulatory protein [Candidatus Sericytochromatia bacterium]